MSELDTMVTAQTPSGATAEQIAETLIALRDARDLAERRYAVACGEFMAACAAGERVQASDGRYVTHQTEGADTFVLDAGKAVAALEKAGIKVPRKRQAGKRAHVVVK